MADTLELKTATTEQLKAFAYDCLARIELDQKNLKAINAEIEFRLTKERNKIAEASNDSVVVVEAERTD